MSGHPSQRRQNNVGSLILSQQDNESLFNYLGRKCITLSSGVVQVYTADRNGSWTKRCCGVACLVKDNPQRSYFIRVLDIRDGKTMFEQELYTGFIDTLQRPYFITFSGDSCRFPNYAANEEETKHFHGALTELTVKRNRKTEKRRDPPNGPALPMATIDIKNPEISNSHRFHNNSQMNSLVHGSFPRRIKKEKVKKKRLTKADIGTPSNFQHVNHIGWNPNTGFDMNNLDPELKNLFDLAGISEAQLKDKETSKAIYDFIEKNGGVEAVKNEVRRQEDYVNFFEVGRLSLADNLTGVVVSSPGPPRWSGRLPQEGVWFYMVERDDDDPPAVVTKVAPPPPPPRGGPPPPPPPQHGSAPPPPPPSRVVRGAPPPPPHSRPPVSPLPPAAASNGAMEANGGDGKSALLSQIREGAQLKKVEQKERPVSTGGRDALLDQIRQGIQLKAVSRDDNSEQTSADSAPTAGIVGALMAAMQKRSKAIHSSDDDDDDDDDDDFEEEDEWDDE
uniref:WASP like actin nucleation promoting factor n=1 Tax=Poecilia formosa TaxID=48698 RepID=A0A096M1Y6_POEFO